MGIILPNVSHISTHAPLARCDEDFIARKSCFHISTHAPLARCDLSGIFLSICIVNFNSRTSCEVRHASAAPLWWPLISTHAPLARCDRGATTTCGRCRFQLTHLLRGATSTSGISSIIAPTFQLTHLLRGATVSLPSCPICRYFNSRTSCEVRRARLGFLRDGGISTHAPLARCDCGAANWPGYSGISTHAPLARCDVDTSLEDHIYDISTHAPLARCDLRFLDCSFAGIHFNSRTSCEVRRSRDCPAGQSPANFNSRTSCEVRPCGHFHFNSRTSCEVRLSPRSGTMVLLKFQLTHLLRGATNASRKCWTDSSRFQLTHLLRGATIMSFAFWVIIAISTHAPLARCDNVH